MTSDRREVATLGGGCFWCIEAALKRLEGVEQIVSGYTGGHVPDPSYEQVCTGRTGHAEVVQVTFDPDAISFREVLEVFFTVHDPTTLNRQGPDSGPQYRSTILYHDETQRETAQALIRELEAEGVWQGIVTEVVPLEAFYPAEAYHQDYYANHPYQPYCMAVIAPKLKKLQERWTGKLKQPA